MSMQKPNPSSEWTTEDRLSTIKWLAQKLQLVAQREDRRPLNALAVENIGAWIGALTSAPGNYLERERKRILSDVSEGDFDPSISAVDQLQRICA
jgi:hypothetical protein